MGPHPHRRMHLRASLSVAAFAIALSFSACAAGSPDDQAVVAGVVAAPSEGDAAQGSLRDSIDPVEGGRGQPSELMIASSGGLAVDAAAPTQGEATDAGAEPPDELAFANPTFGLGPNVTIVPPAVQPSTAFSARLLAGNQAAAISRSAQVAGAQVDYWADTHAVVMTVNHALVHSPSAGWLDPLLDQVTTIGEQVWGQESTARLKTVGLDWTTAAPSLVILDEANSAELLCSGDTMIAIGSGEVAVTPEGLATACQ